MHTTARNYAPDFILQCKREFGLSPEEIKHIVVTLSCNGALDVDRLLQEHAAFRNKPKDSVKRITV